MEINEENNMKNLTDLEDFQGWSSLAAEEDFFKDIEEESEEKKTEVAEKKEGADDTDVEESVDDEKTSKEKKKEESTETDLFDENKEVENVENIKKEEGNEDTQSSTVSAVNLLKEKGLIDFELEDGKELTEEAAEEILEEKYEETVEKRIEELFNDLPDVVKQINKFALDGGDVKEFFNSLAKTNSSGLSEDLDLEDEDNQELVVKEMLKAEDNDDEEIETQLEFLKESGKLEMFAQKKFEKWKKIKEAEKEKLLNEQKIAKQREKEAIKKAKQETVSFLSSTEELGELKLSKADKKVLPSYINDKTVKLQNGATITQMQKELFYDLPQNSKAFMQLAVLMKNRNKDGTFNFESITKNIETKVTKKVKENVRRSKQSVPTKSKNQSGTPKRSLADFFN